MRYAELFTTFWRDEKVRGWSDDARTMALYLLTNHERRAEGFYQLPLVLALDELGWATERLEAALTTLAGDGFAHYENGVVFIVRALKYHAPNSKQQRAAVNALDGVHGASELFWKFLAAADRYCPDLATGIRQKYSLTDRASALPG